MDFFLCVIGMVMIVEGLPYFTFPVKMKTWIIKVAEMPDRSEEHTSELQSLTNLVFRILR